MELVARALAAYGATIGEQGAIVRNGKTLAVSVEVRGKRIRFHSTENGRLLASGPIEAASVENFVESFWFWTKGA